MSTQKLGLTKPVKTRSGLKLRILCTDAPGSGPVVCMDDAGYLYKFTLEGKYLGSPMSDLNLINTPEMVEIGTKAMEAAREIDEYYAHGRRLGEWTQTAVRRIISKHFPESASFSAQPAENGTPNLRTEELLDSMLTRAEAIAKAFVREKP